MTVTTDVEEEEEERGKGRIKSSAKFEMNHLRANKARR